MSWLVLLVACVPGVEPIWPAELELPFLAPPPRGMRQDPNLPPLEWVDQSWPLMFAEETALGPYAKHSGWVSLVMKRDYPAAVRDLGPVGKLDAARAHGELAYLYREAARVAASAWLETYAEKRRSAAAEHLVAVSYALLGQMDEARAASDRVDGSDSTLARWHGPWREWIGSGGAWPPDLRGLPFDLPPPTVGMVPEVGSLPHYTSVEPNGAWRDVADPGVLVALALWHEVAASAADGAGASGMRVVRAMYRLGGEPTPAAEAEVAIELLFGSDHLTIADALFAAELSGTADPSAVISAWADKSIAAWIASRVLADRRLDAASALQRVDALREVLRARADEKTEGLVLAHHATFADLGALGVLRTLVVAADRLGDERGGAALRDAIRTRSVRAGADPVSALSLAAADLRLGAVASARAQVDGLVSRYPSLAVDLYAIDALAEQ